MPQGLRLRVLGARELVVLRAAAGRLLAGASPGPAPAAIPARLDAHLAGIDDPLVPSGIRRVLRILEYSPWLRGYLGRFSQLPPPAQDAVLGWLALSRVETFRVTYSTVHTIAAFFHYADPSTWAALGYEGPWVGRLPIPAYEVDYGERNGMPFRSGTRTFAHEPEPGAAGARFSVG